MNAIIISAIWGVIMMFSGIFFKENAPKRILATLGVLVLLVVTCLDLAGYHLAINTHNMMNFESFGLLFC